MAGKYLGFKVKKDNKLRGAYGETDFDKKVIRINKKAHKSKKIKRITPNKNGKENLLTTISHEMMHVKHPNMGERGVEKLARAMRSRLSTKSKAKIYAKAQ